ncbi:MAG: phosphotransferase, partial [Bacteroidota bacterium]
ADKIKILILSALLSISQQFQIRGLPVLLEPLSVGLIHQSYVLSTAANGVNYQYLLQQLNHYVFSQPEQIMENIAVVAQHLKQTDYPLRVLEAIPTTQGSYLLNHQGQYFRLFPFFKHSLSANVIADENMAYEAARAFGWFDAFLSDLPTGRLHTTIPDFHNTPLRLQQLKHAIQQGVSKRVIRSAKVVDELLSYQSLLRHYSAMEQQLRPVHYDTKINNLLLDASTRKPIAVIDLDTMMPGLLAYDYGDMVRTMAARHDENHPDFNVVSIRPEVLRAINEGFLEAMGDRIQAAEKKALPYGAALIIFEQSLRFLSDYLLGDRYYRIAYADQNFVRAQNQLALLKDYLRQTNLKL